MMLPTLSPQKDCLLLWELWCKSGMERNTGKFELDIRQIELPDETEVQNRTLCTVLVICMLKCFPQEMWMTARLNIK